MARSLSPGIPVAREYSRSALTGTLTSSSPGVGTKRPGLLMASHCSVEMTTSRWSRSTLPRGFGRLSGLRGVELASTNYSGRYASRAEVLCAFIKDHRVAVTAYMDGALKAWDIRAGKQITQVVTDAAFRCIAASGARLCLGDDQGHLHWFSLENIENGLTADSPPLELIWPDWCPR